MAYQDLRDFIHQLAARGDLKRVSATVDPCLEMTEISDRILRAKGPALLFENPKNHRTPVLTNLFGTTERVAMGMGLEKMEDLRELGMQLAMLKEPEPPKGLRDAWQKLPMLRQVMAMSPKTVREGYCQTQCWRGSEVDLGRLPIQTCWPGDAGPLITWGLVVTQGPDRGRQNLGIYRQQVIDRNKVIMRWLSHRGGALDFQAWRKTYPGQKFPVSVVLGADPATILSAVTPIPNHISEYAFAGLLRGAKTELVKCLTNDLMVPSRAEFVLEGSIAPEDVAIEGPFGDHTGYYNETEKFPVLTIDCITQRSDPIYHSTYTGRPPDEPAILGLALNELFIPLLRKQFPEIQDFYLPPEGCSYRMAVVTIKKAYAGHAKRVMMGVWSYLTQFMYTKFLVVTDDDIDARNWEDVIWAMTTRMDPQRDTVIIENTPIDYLDFASPVAGLGSKMGFDATHKWPAETSRVWGEPIIMSAEVKARVDSLWDTLFQ